MQLNNDAYSNYNSLQTAFKVRDHSRTEWPVKLCLVGRLIPGRRIVAATSSTNSRTRTTSDKDSSGELRYSLELQFHLVYEMPRVSSSAQVVGRGLADQFTLPCPGGRPFTAFVQADPSNQGLRDTYANYDGSPLNYDNHYAAHGKDAFFNTTAFSAPDPGQIGNAGRNSLRQPGISQLDMGIFKNFHLSERFSVKFKWEVFNVLNHAMFATENLSKVGS